MAKSKLLQSREEKMKLVRSKIKKKSYPVSNVSKPVISQKTNSCKVVGVFREMNYKEVSQRDSVVVICAGPSLNKYSKEVVEYIKNNNSLVFAANYNFEDMGIISDYTYITDQNKLIENISKIHSHLVVPVKMKTDYNLDFVDKCLKPYGGKVKNLISHMFDVDRYKVYQVGKRNRRNVYSIEGDLSISADGIFPYKRLGSAGQGSIMISMLAKPKKMLVVGLDGPNKKGNKLDKQLYDGRSIGYDVDKFARMADYIKNTLLPFVTSHNIEMETFSGVQFYGINKEKSGVKIIG